MQNQELQSSTSLNTLPSIINDELFHNRNGYLRLLLVNKYFGLFTKEMGSYLDDKGMSHIVNAKIQIKPLTPTDLDAIMGIYTSWRDHNESVPFKYVYRDYNILDTQDGVFTYLKKGKETSEPISSRIIDFYSRNFDVACNDYKGFVYVPIEIDDWSAIPCCKRGNAVYIDKVKLKFKVFTEQEPLVFFDTDLKDTQRKRKRKTSMLYVSGTTDPSICGFDMGWLEFGSHWNSFITNIKQQFGGKIVYIRTWQSHENGYPHFHSLIYFRDREFTAVPNWDYNEKTHKRDKLTWRIPSRAKLHKGDTLTIRQRIKNAWKYGTIDILCVPDTHKAFKDMLKYVTRDLSSGECDLTNAMIWYFGKQSFSYSKDFASVVWGTSGNIDLSVDNIDVDSIISNRSNSNLEMIRVEIYPIISDDLLYKNPPKFHQRRLMGGKDPPSEYEIDVAFVSNSITGYVMVECMPSEKFDCPVFRWVPGS